MSEFSRLLYAFITTDANGVEAPSATYHNGMWMPLVVSREEILDHFYPFMMEMAEATGVKVERRVYQMVENSLVIDCLPKDQKREQN